MGECIHYFQCVHCGKDSRVLTDLQSQLAAVTKEREEERRKLATAVEALECITRCDSNEFSEEPDVIARRTLAAIRAGEERK
jgi:glutaredoxin